MSGDVPFGFTPGEGDDPGDGGPGVPSPFGAGGFDPSSMDMAQFGAALQQLGQMLQSGGGSDGGAVNWELARDTARGLVAQQGDPSVSAIERHEVEQALDLATLWLDPVTSFPATSSGGGAWSRSEWIEATLPQWRRIVEPVAEKVNESMSGMLPTGGLPEGLPPELAAMAAPLLGMARQMGSMMFGGQLGQGLGTLAGEVLGAADVGIPLTDDGRSALVPRNVAAFGEGLGVDAEQVRLYLALREAASQRLFAHVPWLRSQLTAAVEAYAGGIHVDRERIERAAQEIDLQNPESMQEVLASGVFVPDDTPEQLAALSRLETLLALVEGWVDDVTTEAASNRLPAADALRETMRRRRATGGPAERTFATLVGLELRPRRLREAAALWDAVRAARGSEGRDALWEHPDFLPTADDLDSPEAIEAFVRRSAPLDLSALDDLPEAPGGGDAGDGGGHDSAPTDPEA
ncbi:MAG TPA: zinc-dependent metalloprotease [Candidatus Nanopelagicales bacterium]